MVIKTATPELIQEMVDRIVRDFNPVKVILFGSQARGDAGPDSDVDLLVVMDDGLESVAEAEIGIAGCLAGMGVAKDVIVTTPDEIRRRGHVINTVLRWALRDGRTLYERS